MYLFYDSFVKLFLNIDHFNAEVEKQLGSWNNAGVCVSSGDDPACGPGNQKQVRTCIDGTNDKCTASDTVQTVSCNDAGTALPACIIEKTLGSWSNDGNCVATGNDPACGPGNQRQTRTCVDGSVNKCTDAEKEQTISCSDAGTALPDCSE